MRVVRSGIMLLLTYLAPSSPSGSIIRVVRPARGTSRHIQHVQHFENGPSDRLGYTKEHADRRRTTRSAIPYNMIGRSTTCCESFLGLGNRAASALYRALGSVLQVGGAFGNFPYSHCTAIAVLEVACARSPIRDMLILKVCPRCTFSKLVVYCSVAVE